MPVLHAGLLGCSVFLLVAIAIIDARSGGMPDWLTLPFIVVAAAYGFLTGSSPWIPALIGGGFFALQWLVSRGSWVGSGDILLGIGIGFLLVDIPSLLIALAAAYIAGALVASVLLLRGKITRKSILPFGPFLAGGTLLTMAFFSN